VDDAAWPAVASMACVAAARTASARVDLRAGTRRTYLLAARPMLAAVTHLRPTAELAERALLPDDPGQALALTRVLFDATPRMFNHHRGLWGYSGLAVDGAPLTVQSTGVGGPSAAIVVAELHALGLRRAVRIGRAWGLADLVRPGDLVAAERVLCGDGASRALAGAESVLPDAELAAALIADRRGALASGDLVEPDPAWDALAHDLESAAVLAAASRAGVRAATLVAIVAPAGDDDAVAERLGRAALAAIATPS
jgi:uridine phosphorylase